MLGLVAKKNILKYSKCFRIFSDVWPKILFSNFPNVYGLLGFVEKDIFSFPNVFGCLGCGPKDMIPDFLDAYRVLVFAPRM